MKIHGDPDPGQSLPTQKIGFWHEKYTLCRGNVIKHTNVGTKATVLKAGNQVYFLNFGQYSVELNQCGFRSEHCFIETNLIISQYESWANYSNFLVQKRRLRQFRIRTNSGETKKVRIRPEPDPLLFSVFLVDAYMSATQLPLPSESGKED